MIHNKNFHKKINNNYSSKIYAYLIEFCKGKYFLNFECCIFILLFFDLLLDKKLKN